MSKRVRLMLYPSRI
ncbi:UNVERIFIED_CONTAM: hypothetical protein GTU68_046667 [Idotea baltica]|nr:hypothetical protein [Idotea baltica]